jgi:hypothetical protein
MGLSVSEIKSERTDGVIRRELVSEESARRPEQPVISVHPCSGKGVFSRHCKTPYTKGAFGAGAARQRRRCDQGIPAGSSQSAVPYVSILPWRLGRNWPVTNAHGAKPPGENLAIELVAIADESIPQTAAATGRSRDLRSCDAGLGFGT